jgi:hypothetical protein
MASLEEKGDKETDRKLELGDTTINKVYTEFKAEQIKEELEQDIERGIALTEEQILQKLGVSIRPYDVWNFKLRDGFGKEHPGRIPADIVFLKKTHK